MATRQCAVLKALKAKLGRSSGKYPGSDQVPDGGGDVRFSDLIVQLKHLENINMIHWRHIEWLRTTCSIIRLPVLFTEIFDIPTSSKSSTISTIGTESNDGDHPNHDEDDEADDDDEAESIEEVEDGDQDACSDRNEMREGPLLAYVNNNNEKKLSQMARTTCQSNANHEDDYFAKITLWTSNDTNHDASQQQQSSTN